MSATSNPTVRIPVSRHLQDFNGYCGPACALMCVEFAGSAKSPPVYAQNEFFREIRNHAKSTKDKRPFKSPAESLLSMLNDHTDGNMAWVKIYSPDTERVAQQIVHAIDETQQPCLMLVCDGMHWVVAFGLQKKDDGTPAGLLMRDPAWTGMPKFYGLSIFPDKPAIEHTESPCPCLDCTENPPGTVHERYITMHELISGRGLQGSLDWEGTGAIALVPDGVSPPAVAPAAIVAPTAMAVANPAEHAGEAALAAVKEHGLYGRPDSPPDWNDALDGAEAGEPILVKDPDDPRDDFYLVPLSPAEPEARFGAWAMLDAKTLELREISLLENWKALAFPDDDSGDAERASRQEHTLPDGTVARFKKEDFKPNTRNLVWKASAASILPYWPLKELIAPHPVTGLPVSIYATQDGEIYSALMPDVIEPASQQASHQAPRLAEPNNTMRNLAIALGGTTLALLGATGYLAVIHYPSDGDAPRAIPSGNGASDQKIKSLEDDNGKLTDALSKAYRDIKQRDANIVEKRKTIDRLTVNNNDLLAKNKQLENEKTSLGKALKENQETSNRLNRQLIAVVSERDRLKRDSNRIIRDVNDSKDTFKKLSDQINLLVAERDAANLRRQAVEKRSAEIGRELFAAKQKFAQAETTISNLRKQLNDLRNKKPRPKP